MAGQLPPPLPGVTGRAITSVSQLRGPALQLVEGR